MNFGAVCLRILGQYFDKWDPVHLTHLGVKKSGVYRYLIICINIII